MHLSVLKYHQFKGHDQAWNLNEVELNHINLIVGKNASGKSKTLSVTNALSMLLGENRPLVFSEGAFDVTFQYGENSYNYKLEYHDYVITNEVLSQNGKVLLKRNEKGVGTIVSSHDHIHSFEIPLNELKAVRRDKTNYPYLEDLYFWASHVRFFNFSSAGKAALAIRDKKKKPTEFELKNTEFVITTFLQGIKKHGLKFHDSIRDDFNALGYNVSTIDIGSLTSLNFQLIDNPSAEVTGLRVKEKDLECWTDQLDMSNGMFRALSLIIHLNFYELDNIPGLILIDDIGEGLDYERSSKLIEMVVMKGEQNSNIQIIMTTNDSFIMNSVDLKYWQIIDRYGPQVHYFNKKNSKNIFDDYEFTGLNHFDFFASEFFKKGFTNDQ